MGGTQHQEDDFLRQGFASLLRAVEIYKERAANSERESDKLRDMICRLEEQLEDKEDEIRRITLDFDDEFDKVLARCGKLEARLNEAEISWHCRNCGADWM